MGKKKLTKASGRPYTEFENLQSAGNRGSVLLQDYFLSGICEEKKINY